MAGQQRLAGGVLAKRLRQDTLAQPKTHLCRARPDNAAVAPPRGQQRQRAGGKISLVGSLAGPSGGDRGQQGAPPAVVPPRRAYL